MDKNKNFLIIHDFSSEEPFWVVDKFAGIPSAPLKQGDFSVLEEVTKQFPFAKNVKGKKEIEYGLLHRIDTQTNGLLLIAGSQEFYDDLLEVQKTGGFIKTYFAECDFIKNLNDFPEGFPAKPQNFLFGKECFVQSKFRYFSTHNSQVRPVDEKNLSRAAKKKAINKIYTTKIKVYEKDKTYFADCEIAQGFKHQVRAHLAWCGFPVKGDFLYNPYTKNSSESANELKFSATKIKFTWKNKNFEFHKQILPKGN